MTLRFLRLPFVALALAVVFPALAQASLSGGDPAPSARRDDMLAYVLNLPETNPYRALLLRHQTLPAADRAALSEWLTASDGSPPPTLGADQQSLVRELSSALVATASAAPTTADDWPSLPDPDAPDNPALSSIPGAGSLRLLARLAAKNATTQPPGDAIATYAAIAQLGRQQRSASSLFGQLLGLATESIGQAAAAKRLGEFSADELDRLSAAWSRLKPHPEIEEALARDDFFQPMLDNIILPGLRELLADSLAPHDGSEPSEGDADFPGNLRLSGLIDLGEGLHKIVLEDTKSGESIAIKLGATERDITLVSLDYTKRIAVIRHRGREALVHIEARRIVARASPAAHVLQMFRIVGASNGASLDEDDFNAMIERVGRHPGGVDGYGRDLLATYRARMNEQRRLAENPVASAPPAPDPMSDDPIARMIIPDIGSFARRFHGGETRTAMLQAAIQHRRVQLGAAAPDSMPPDPWDGGRGTFGIVPAPDGKGFEMTSLYETAPGHRIIYKFAAPDAGTAHLARP